MTRSPMTDLIRQIRAELKDWEKAFAATNGGRKAGRDDIKKVPDIAAKYKEYNQLTGRVSQRATLDSCSREPLKSLKRHHSCTEDSEKSAESPKRVRQLHPVEIDPYDLPLQCTPSASRTYVDPTPQKNGLVLGLFDAPSSAVKGTPSSKRRSSMHASNFPLTPSRVPLTHVQVLPCTTPPKSLATPGRGHGPGRLNLTTPSTQRLSAVIAPGSGKASNDETPLFLKRQSTRFVERQTATVSECEFSPIAVRLPPKPAGKGLSALIQGLRRIEEDRLDEELELLREIEEEESGGIALPRKPTVRAEDNQVQSTSDLPLGADGEEGEDDSKEPEQEDAPTRRPWKKKGQKRTTRKSNIAPSTAKPKPEPSWVDGETLLDKKVTADTGTVSKRQTKKKISATSHANFRALKIRNKNSKGKGGRFRGRGR